MRKAHSKTARVKLSTTVSQETYEFLKSMVSSGQVASIAEAVDTTIGEILRAENRRILAAATTRYFDQMSPETNAKENALGRSMALAGCKIDFEGNVTDLFPIQLPEQRD